MSIIYFETSHRQQIFKNCPIYSSSTGNKMHGVKLTPKPPSPPTVMQSGQS